MFRKLATGFGIAVVAFGAAVSVAAPASAAEESYTVVGRWAGTGNEQAGTCEGMRILYFPSGECVFYNGNTELRVPS
ncbi:hypothetical protein [Amycolatopsis sp. cmx-11-12]|uniref:hypothetical protein n=1 Tax=Amycolatopsis sp. cmx-11-12 TaxID=2785795 RepID=UPI003916F6E9